MTFKTVGYYICETVDTPQYLHAISSRILSVSSCIGEIHPKWECYLGGWIKGEEQAYRNRLHMDEAQYSAFLKDVNALFDAHRIDLDGRFPYLSDAQRFYTTYFANIPCELVCVSTTDAFFGTLTEEFTGSRIHAAVHGEADKSLLLGYDLLGWDMQYFHSFLCNSLHKSLPTAKFNALGLLGNDFEEVKDFARQIEGLGEPVIWIPCRIGKVDADFE